MSRTPASFNLQVVRGATWEDDFEYKEEDGQAFDLTGYEARMQVRTLDGRYGLSDAETLVMELTTGNGWLSIPDPGDGRVVLLVSEPLEVLGISLQVEEAFDGAYAAVALGTVADPDLLLPAAFNAPGVLGVYETAPRAELPAGTEVILTIDAGVGATAGRGQLVITAVPIK